MKTTRINVGSVQVRMSAPPADASHAGAEVAQRVAAQVERRAGQRLPSAAAAQIAGRIARALAAAKRS